MNLPTEKLGQRRKPGYFVGFSTLCSIISVAILATISYIAFVYFPLLGRYQALLARVTNEDVPVLQAEGDLHLLMAEDRTAFFVALAEASQQESLQNLRARDGVVAAGAAKLDGMGPAARQGKAVFDKHWNAYLQQRNGLLALASKGGMAAVVALRSDLGEGSYIAAQEGIRSAEIAQQSASLSHLAAVSQLLEEGKRQLVILVAMKIAVLLLILWLEIRRYRAETMLKAATGSLREQERNFRHAFESATVGMGIFKLDGTVLSVNRKGASLLGYEPEELVGTRVVNVMAPEHRESHLQSIEAARANKDSTYVAERRVIRKDGGAEWVRNSVTLIQPEESDPYFFSISEEITAQKEAYDRLEWLANYDPVTSLPNRRFFEESMAQVLEAQAGGPATIALLYIEIDGFDFLKGTFGRGVADEVLAELGAELRALATEREKIGRLDDYAFGILVPSAAYGESALKRAEELLEIFRRLPGSGAQRIPLSASIGVVYADEGVLKASGTESGEAAPTDIRRGESKSGTMMKLARAAMLEARSRGGDVVHVADPALQDRAMQRHRIEAALLRGIHRDEFRVVFQPQFRISNGALVRFEALCRWDSSELGPIPPDRFIPIAEQSGLMSEVGRRVMLDALRQARRWTDTGRKIGISVNISPVQFMRPDFTGLLADALVVTGFPPALLELEITEGIFIRDLNLAVARIRDLQRLGVSVALDDFGTGYSSLSYLQRMPIDAVKLDRSFVSDLTTDESTVSMVRSVLAMARALNLRVVTEGVETREQLEVLRELGCDEAQGYLLGRPEEADVALQRVMDSPRTTVGMIA
jgi:PAS domain S-box-containing protein/diguanylate cyclase (GGDEF)-like protein